jgi:hypothetical protein
VDLGVYISDATWQNFGLNTFVDDKEVAAVQIDTSATSTHTITYRIQNAAGLSAQASRTVEVYDPNTFAPLPAKTEATTTSTSVSSIASTSTPETITDVSTSTPPSTPPIIDNQASMTDTAASTSSSTSSTL